MLRQHPASVRAARRNVPVPLSLLILRLLAKRPEDRPSIDEAVGVLRRWEV